MVIALVAGVVAACGAGGEPSPSASPSGAGAEGDAVRYSCGGPPGFLPTLVDEPATAELEDHPSAAALRAALADPSIDLEFLPDAGWWLVARDDARAEYVARRDEVGAEHPFAHASFEQVGGSWKIAGWGDCKPTIVLDGLNIAQWVLDDAVPPPGPETTQVRAFVTERECTGAEPMRDRLQAPRITYTETAVIVVFTVVPLEGGMFTCPGNPPQLVTFELREPLGDRVLLDGAFFPPVEPVPEPF
jgi:hypothetical protein